MTIEALKRDAHVEGDEFHDSKNFPDTFHVYLRLMLRNLNSRFLSRPSNSKKQFCHR